jgi:hypothetical protein
MEVNPDDIESVSVLKGQVRLLFGTRASNGVYVKKLRMVARKKGFQ